MVRRKIIGGEEKEVGGSLLCSLRDSAIKKFGSSAVFDSASFLDSIYGVPIRNNLILQHLLGIDVLALGRDMTVTGGYGATKSSFTYLLAKMFAEYGGFSVYIDAEHKANPDQILALYGDRGLMDSSFLYTTATSLDEVRGSLNYYAEQYPILCPKKDKPMLLIWDSMNAVTSEDGAEEQSKNEQGGFRAARNAAETQEFLKYYVPKKLAKLPILLVVVNHLKVKIDSNTRPGMPPPTYSPGGGHKDFTYTWALEFSKAGTKQSKTCVVKHVKIKPGKSSLGPTYSYGIVVPYVSHYKQDGSEVLYYDWDYALVDFLTSDLVSKEALKKVMHLNRQGAKVSSDTLGLKDVSLTEAGMAIHNNAELCAELQKQVLRIRVKRKVEGKFVDVKPICTVDEEEIRGIEEAGAEATEAPIRLELPDESAEEDSKSGA